MAEEEKKKEEAAAPAKAEKEKGKVGKFTRGDHSVHLFIQKGKKFVPIVETDQ